MKYFHSKIIVIIVALFAISACKTTQPVKVYSVDDVGLPASATTVYALPKTVLQITVYQSSISSHAGPLHRYAEKYLQLKHIIKQNKTEYYIDSIAVNSYPVIDTNRIYVIENIENTVAENIKLCPDGRLIGFNSVQTCNDFKPYKVSYLEEFASTAEPLQYLDSIVLPRIYYTLRTDEEKAKFLVEQLHIMEEDINYLRVGETPGSGFPDGRALEFMINELKQEQENYISLFRGRRSKHSKTFVYTVIPDDSNMFSTRILFRFAPERGVLDVTNMAGEPVYLDLINQGTNKHLDNYSASYILNKQKNEEFNGLFYRIPEHTKIRIRDDHDVFTETNTLIAQFGPILNLPDYILKNPKNRIEFDPQYGSLKCIDYNYIKRIKENDD